MPTRSRREAPLGGLESGGSVRARPHCPHPECSTQSCTADHAQGPGPGSPTVSTSPSLESGGRLPL